MKRPRAYRTAAMVGCLVVTSFLAIAACSNQGEGERCEVLNGNDDCKTSEGLICVAANLLTNSISDRCCPSDRSKATAPVCKLPVEISGGDANAPADTGPPTTPDAGQDADGGGEPDAATDAQNVTDAAADG